MSEQLFSDLPYLRGEHAHHYTSEVVCLIEVCIEMYILIASQCCQTSSTCIVGYFQGEHILSHFSTKSFQELQNYSHQNRKPNDNYDRKLW